ncbi:MAG: (2Fe-2S)-binding protein [Rhodospirillales bacterium]|nr:(2Fe-2S)-binding protein [Rhodospirillales bacterium]
MYVCLCNAYRCSQIRDAVRAGHDDAEEIYFALGGGPVCGSCLDEAQALVDSERAALQVAAE